MEPSDIEIRSLVTYEELHACVALQRETWGETFTDVVPVSILKVSQRIGGVAAGAFAGGRLVGFVFGLTGLERGNIVHWSDMLAVRPEARNLGLGRRLKEHQRTVARELGATVIYWTYDPLVARNAHLNFNRLGARAAEYVENMYGLTDSVLHGGMPTDRIVVAWPTADDEIAERLADVERAVSSSDCRNAPIATDEWIEGAVEASILPHCVRVEVPANIEATMHDSPEDARRWRERVRRGLQWTIGEGYAITAFVLDASAERGYYIMTKRNHSPHSRQVIQ